jgi:hypothetical protein
MTSQRSQLYLAVLYMGFKPIQTIKPSTASLGRRIVRLMTEPTAKQPHRWTNGRRRSPAALVIALPLMIGGVATLPAGAYATQPAALHAPTFQFHDGFEANGNWQTFEEVVGGNPCYGTGIGQVTRSTQVALAGSHSLQVASNAAGSHLSNHLIAHNKISGSPLQGSATMIAWARQEAAGTGGLGETGPELSYQSTRQQVPGTFITTVAGIQYLTNPASPLNGTWQVWRDSGGTPGWAPLVTQPIQRGTWYQLILQADFTTGRYTRFTIMGGGVARSVDLSGVSLGSENKGFLTQATELTLEAEAAWSNCGLAAPTKFTVNYDEVTFRGKR